jgi:hypothetical protein
LVVETSTGQRGQANGFSFYAVRGPAFMLKQIPKSAGCITFDTNPNSGCDPGTVGAFDGLFASPCQVLWNGVNVLTDCTLEVYRDGPQIKPLQPPVDRFFPKLKPGFIISAAIVQISTLKEAQGDVLNPYMLKFSGNQVIVTEQPMLKAAGSGQYFSFYGIKLFVYGPAGIANPLADGQ